MKRSSGRIIYLFSRFDICPLTRWRIDIRTKSLDMVLPFFRRKALFLWPRSSNTRDTHIRLLASWNCCDILHIALIQAWRSPFITRLTYFDFGTSDQNVATYKFRLSETESFLGGLARFVPRAVEGGRARPDNTRGHSPEKLWAHGGNNTGESCLRVIRYQCSVSAGLFVRGCQSSNDLNV